MFWRGQTYLTYLIWGTLIVAAVAALLLGRWSIAFVSLATLLASMLPVILARWFRLHLPISFVSAIVLFAFGTLFLGEVFDFYERYWWWDIVLHGGSAVGFGLIGFVFIFYLFEGDKYAAPAWAIAFLSFCLALSIGAVWEMFEFGMDQIFGLNMQKSGLVDTMYDLMVDAIGSTMGAIAGFLYLKARESEGMRGLTGVISEFVRKNRRIFRKSGGSS